MGSSRIIFSWLNLKLWNKRCFTRCRLKYREIFMNLFINLQTKLHNVASAVSWKHDFLTVSFVGASVLKGNWSYRCFKIILLIMFQKPVSNLKTLIAPVNTCSKLPQMLLVTFMKPYWFLCLSVDDVIQFRPGSLGLFVSQRTTVITGTHPLPIRALSYDHRLPEVRQIRIYFLSPQMVSPRMVLLFFLPLWAYPIKNFPKQQ